MLNNINWIMDWLSGDPGLYAVYFDGPDDPRVAEYSAIFEDGVDHSVDPECYRMLLYPYQTWLDEGSADYFDPDFQDF